MLETQGKEKNRKEWKEEKEKVRHLARVKEGKHSGEAVTDGAEQGDGFQRETRSCTSLSLRVVYRRRRLRTSGGAA